MTEPERHNCRRCVHFSEEFESWEMPWVRWYQCNAETGYDSLRSFPFKNTTCRRFRPKTEEKRD
jgi:hypothetical protein